MTTETRTTSDTEAQVTTSSQTTPTSGPTTSPAPGTTPKFQVFSTFYLEHLDVGLRRAVYLEVREMVQKGTMPGIVHRDNLITVQMSEGRSGKRTKALDELLLKNLPDLEARLDTVAETVMGRMVTQRLARGVTVEDLTSMGDSLDFDAMIAAARRQRQSQTRGSKKKGVLKK